MHSGLARDVSSELPLSKEKRERKTETSYSKTEDAEEGGGGVERSFGCHQLLKWGRVGSLAGWFLIDWKCFFDEQVTTR